MENPNEVTEIIFGLDIDDATFLALVAKCKERYNGTSKKYFTEFMHRNLLCETTLDTHQATVYRRTTMSSCDENGLCHHHYTKEKQPYHVFPSLKNLHSVAYVTKTAFRVSSGLGVVFETRCYKSTQEQKRKYNKAYLSITKRVSPSLINDTIKHLTR